MRKCSYVVVLLPDIIVHMTWALIKRFSSSEPLRHLIFLSPNTLGDGPPGTRNIYQTILPIVILAPVVCTSLPETIEAWWWHQRNILDTDHVPIQTIQIKFAPDESLRHSTLLGPHTLGDGTPGTWDTYQIVLPIVDQACCLSRRSNRKTPPRQSTVRDP